MNPNPEVVCNYSLIQFMPYRQTGEFVNIGLVLFCSETGFFDSRLEIENQKRITDFFPEFEIQTYLKGKKYFEAELQRVKEVLSTDQSNINGPAKLGIFRELVKPRESSFSFGPIGTVLTTEPTSKLHQLFDVLVNRQFASSVASI